MNKLKINRKVLLYTTIGKLNEETESNTNLAFSSWKKFGFDVVVFGEDFNRDFCNKYGFILDTNFEKTEFNLPLV